MIRPMEVSDKEGFIDLMELFVTERMAQDGAVFCRESSMSQFDVFFHTKGFNFIVCEVDKQIVGVIVIMVGPALCCKGLIAQELVWYVKKEHRTCGVRLLRAAEKLAKDSGCDSLIMCGMAGDKANEFYVRYGYKPLQNSYQRRME